MYKTSEIQTKRKGDGQRRSVDQIEACLFQPLTL